MTWTGETIASHTRAQSLSACTASTHGAAMHGAVDRLPAFEATDADRIARAGGQRCRPRRAGRAARGLHDQDAAQRLAGGERLADEQIHVRQQKAAGAELQDRGFQHSTIAFTTPASGSSSVANFSGTSASAMRCVFSAAGIAAVAHRRDHGLEVLGRRVAAAEQRRLALVELGIGEA